MVVLFGVADFLEANCSGKARDAIAAVLALKPETAILADTGARGSLIGQRLYRPQQIRTSVGTSGYSRTA